MGTLLTILIGIFISTVTETFNRTRVNSLVQSKEREAKESKEMSSCNEKMPSAQRISNEQVKTVNVGVDNVAFHIEHE